MDYVLLISQLQKIKTWIMILGGLIFLGAGSFFLWEAYFPYSTKIKKEDLLFQYIKKQTPQRKLNKADDETIRAFMQQSALKFKIYIPFKDVTVTYDRHEVPADQAQPLLMGYVLDVHLVVFGWKLYSDRITRVLPVAGTKASSAIEAGK